MSDGQHPLSWFDTWMPSLDSVKMKEKFGPQITAARAEDGAVDGNANKDGTSAIDAGHRGVVSKEAPEEVEFAVGAIAEFDGTAWNVISEKAMPAFLKKKLDPDAASDDEEDDEDEE